MEGYSRENFEKAQTDEEKQVLLKKAHEEASREDKDFEYSKEQKLKEEHHGVPSDQDMGRTLSKPEAMLLEMKKILVPREKRYEIELGGKTAEEYKMELKDMGIRISQEAQYLLNSKDFTISGNTEDFGLVVLMPEDLGFGNDATREKIYKKAELLGLMLCQPDDAPALREVLARKENVFIAMDPIPDNSDEPCTFYLSESMGSKLLGTSGVSVGESYDGGVSKYAKFAFRFRKSEF